MRLLQKTNRYYLIFSAILFLLTSVILYLLLTFISKRELDENLLASKNRIINQIEKRETLPVLPPLIIVEKISDKIAPKTVIKDTMIYNSSEKEMEPLREIRSVENINGKNYRITIRRSLIETADLRLAIGLSVGSILALLFAGLFFINRKISGSVWTPFYNNLDVLKEFSFEQSNPIILQSSGILEFEELNRVIDKLISKVRSDYHQLKEFTENASHESQTPLAIIQSKLELLMQHPGLDKEQAILIESIGKAVRHLNKLNKALLLLAKIENRQYSEKEELHLSEIIQEQVDHLAEMVEAREISLELHLEQHIIVQGNPLLMEVLLFNLLNNAVKHNIPNGLISVQLTTSRLVISNTGSPLKVEPNKLFERFYKADATSDSLGLGLSIVRKICDVSGYRISYSKDKDLHTIVVEF